jgi:3-hydroxy-9,10-secoandrosta-1,3,5(10)-triene-9,17-dione monooxygenase
MTLVSDSTTLSPSRDAIKSHCPGHDELVTRAAALRDVLWADAADADRDRRLTDRVVSDITEAGLLRLMTPPRFGGYQVDMRTYLDVTTELGKGCCSASWVTGVLNAGSFLASLFPVAAQEEVWTGGPDTRVAIVLGAPRAKVDLVDGGVRIYGEWPYASGCLHAEWVCVLVPSSTRSADPEVHFVLVPIEEVAIADTWYFAGMRGSGSNTIVADGVFVPHHRAIPFVPLLNGEAAMMADASHLYRNSLMGLFAVGLLGALIGGAEAALAFVHEMGPGRPVAATTYANASASPTFQLDLSRASTMVDGAKLFAHRITDTVDAHAHQHRLPDMVTRGRHRADSTFVAEQCRDAIDVLLTAFGSSAFSESNPLQRIWRDINVGSRHAAFGMGVPQQIHGRALVGQDPRAISHLV